MLLPKYSQVHLLAPDNPLEPLLRNLSLGCSNDSLGVGVAEAAASLAVLLASRLGRADAVSGSSNLRAACRAAVGIRDTSSGDELGAVSLSDVLRSSVVGGDLGHGGSGNYLGHRQHRIHVRYLEVEERTRNEGGDGETHFDGCRVVVEKV